jgi:hypothetical protein
MYVLCGLFNAAFAWETLFNQVRKLQSIRAIALLCEDFVLLKVWTHKFAASWTTAFVPTAFE